MKTLSKLPLKNLSTKENKKLLRKFYVSEIFYVTDSVRFFFETRNISVGIIRVHKTLKL